MHLNVLYLDRVSGVSLLHWPQYLQLHSLVSEGEERSHYSTSVTLHPPLCCPCCLHALALKCAERIAVSQLPPQKTKATTTVHKFTVLKYNSRKFDATVKRSPSTARLPLICWHVGM